MLLVSLFFVAPVGCDDTTITACPEGQAWDGDRCSDNADEGVYEPPAPCDVIDIGSTCTVGEGVCRSEGLWICNATGDNVICDAELLPASEETCNGLDDDCDGRVDNMPVLDPGETAQPVSCQTGMGGMCEWGTVTGCQDGEVVCTPSGWTETCNGMDDDCDGAIDEDLEGCGCYPGGACQIEGLSDPCSQGEYACPPVDPNNPTGTTYRVCQQRVFPTDEICNGVDDNCDGDIDETFPESQTSCVTAYPGVCSQGQLVCPNGAGMLECEKIIEPGSNQEICDGLDNDCDGQIDEENICDPDTGVPIADAGLPDVGPDQGIDSGVDALPVADIIPTVDALPPLDLGMEDVSIDTPTLDMLPVDATPDPAVTINPINVTDTVSNCDMDQNCDMLTIRHEYSNHDGSLGATRNVEFYLVDGYLRVIVYNHIDFMQMSYVYFTAHDEQGRPTDGANCSPTVINQYSPCNDGGEDTLHREVRYTYEAINSLFSEEGALMGLSQITYGEPATPFMTHSYEGDTLTETHETAGEVGYLRYFTALEGVRVQYDAVTHGPQDGGTFERAIIYPPESLEPLGIPAQ
ncbi:MAG: hypothetical protein HOE80_04455 [Candidatus Magasanikbacteria bacterium]|jgi:hypothetical protein|nr:hypothetical protein [Candidatus Magasanikbacteria bacterium]